MSAFSQFHAAWYSADLWRWKQAGLQGQQTAAHPPFQTEGLWLQYTELKGRRGMFDCVWGGLNQTKPKYSLVLTIVSGLPAAISPSEHVPSADKFQISPARATNKRPLFWKHENHLLQD